MTENEPFSQKERLTYAAMGMACIIAVAVLWTGTDSINLAGIASLLAAFGFGAVLPSPIAAAK